MKYVKATPNSSGAYPAPHGSPFPGCLPLTDGQAETLVQYNGFVTITREPDPEIETSSVTVTPDLEAWETWKAQQPEEPEPVEQEEPGGADPTLTQRVTTLEADTAELGEALDLILTGYTGEEEPADETGEGTA